MSDEDLEYRDQLEAMGVDLVGSKARQEQQRQAGGDDVDFDAMDDRQVWGWWGVWVRCHVVRD